MRSDRRAVESQHAEEYKRRGITWPSLIFRGFNDEPSVLRNCPDFLGAEGGSEKF